MLRIIEKGPSKFNNQTGHLLGYSAPEFDILDMFLERRMIQFTKK